MIKTYYMLTKPGIICGNIITTAAGFALASRGSFDFLLFLATLVGLTLIVASACVFNNYIDRDIDKKMARTQNRPLAKGLISAPSALTFASFLLLAGILVFAKFTNLLTLLVALTGFFVYVVLYGILKVRTIHGTVIGSISGAIPPVIGYCAVSNHIDAGAVLIFLILALWQMPHFLAIAMYRLDDYTAAAVPVLPVMRGMRVTKIHMLFYTIGFVVATLLPFFWGYTGYAYLIAAVVLGFTWLWLCIKGFKSDNDKLWARQMFRLSLVIITVLCTAISFDSV